MENMKTWGWSGMLAEGNDCGDEGRAMRIERARSCRCVVFAFEPQLPSFQLVTSSTSHMPGVLTSKTMSHRGERPVYAKEIGRAHV